MSSFFKPANTKDNRLPAGKLEYYIFMYKFIVIIAIIVALILSAMFFASTLAIIEYLDFGDILKNHNEEIGTVDAEGSSTTSGVTVAPGENGYQFYQQDYADVQFGTSDISSGDCGITSMAMCISDLFGDSIDPKQLASEFNINPYWVDEVGVSWDFFGACAEHYGVQCQELGRDPNVVVQALREGKKVLSSQDADFGSKFTQHGHIIYFYGLDSSGNIVVKDPNRSNVVDKGLTSHSWDPSEICSWSRNNWAIWK